MYFAVYDSDKNLVSVGTSIASKEELSERGLTAKQFNDGDGPPIDKNWNPQTLDFDISRPAAIPNKTAIQRLEQTAEFKAMTATEKRLALAVVKALSPE